MIGGRGLVWAAVAAVAAVLIALQWMGGTRLLQSELTRDRVVHSLAVEESCQASATSGCRGVHNDLVMTLRLPENPRALEAFHVDVFTAGAQSLAIDAVEVEMLMTGMDMGLNRGSLSRQGPSHWRTAITLPICTQGRSDWVAVVRAVTDGSVYEGRFPFTLGG